MIGPIRESLLGVRRGVTLIELMISVSVLGIILPAVLVLQLQGLRMYQDVAANDQASFQAASAIELMESEIEGCFRVTGRYADRITLAMPKLTYDTGTSSYIPVQPLTYGDSVRYYLADETGNINRPEECLWHAVKPTGGSSFTVDRAPLASGISTLEFSYTTAPSPRQDIVSRVSVLVRAHSKEGATTRERTHTGQLVLRNVNYGPVTHDPGTDPLEE